MGHISVLGICHEFKALLNYIAKYQASQGSITKPCLIEQIDQLKLYGLKNKLYPILEGRG